MDDPEPANLDQLRQKYFKANQQQQQSQGPQNDPSPSPSQQEPGGAFDPRLVNPYELGRQARQAFNDVWEQLSRVSSPTRSYIIDETLEVGADAEFAAPQAAYTTVLVIGATGRVGRILVRKLLLRGYTVKALVRNRSGVAQDVLPAAVELVEGDVGDLGACQRAVKGVNKVIFCAAARSTFTADLLRVDDRGVMNVVKAFQDEAFRRAKRVGDKHVVQAKREIADFKQPYHQARWDVTFVGTVEDASGAGAEDPRRAAFRPSNTAVAEINAEDNLVFEGTLLERGAIAEVGARLGQLLPGGEHRTKGTEGLVMRVRGDGHQYLCILETEDGSRYGARFPTREGYLSVRLPYTAFRPEYQGQPPLEPEKLSGITIRYENRRSAAVASLRAAKGMSNAEATARRQSNFNLEVDWIKALPGGQEPDVVLVSCAGKSRPGVDAAELRKVVEAKRKGEENLRLSGLGYTIIRPGTLVDEPGGYKALVFDQGDRITEAISAADVADICLRALHEPEGRNKTFDVCYEFQSEEGNAMYELVAHVPDKRSNYLRAAVTSLAKNT